MCRRAAALALIFVAGCRTELWDLPDAGQPGPTPTPMPVPGSPDLSSGGMPLPPDLLQLADFAASADLSQLPPSSDIGFSMVDAGFDDGGYCQNVTVAPNPINFACDTKISVGIFDLCQSGVVTISSVELGGGNPEEFVLTDVPMLPITLAAGAGFDVTIAFKPQQPGVQLASLDLVSSAGHSSAQILAGPPTLQISPKVIGWGLVPLYGTSSPAQTQLINNGTCTMHVTSMTFSGEAPQDFAIVGQPPAIIGGRMSVPLQVVFTPSMPGNRTAILTIVTDDPQGPRTLTVAGSS
jgi:hypothetical protein